MKLRRLANMPILLTCLLFSGCAAVQRAILEADITNSISEPKKSDTQNVAPAEANSANASANPTQDAGQVTTRAVVPSEVPRRICDRNKVVRVGMNVAEVYRSCWGRPKSVNTSVLGATKTEMLLYEGYNYIYVENGVVKSIETSGR